MIMGAIGNALADDMLRTAFVTPDFKAALRPLMGVEEFGADPRGCTITGTSRSDQLAGTPGDDVICAGADDDVIDATQGGNDTIYGDAGHDRIATGPGEDTVYGDAGNDQIVAGPGDDVISGGLGDDRLIAGPGADFSEGGEGHDLCLGSAGSGDASDSCEGGPAS
jgi:Ca2+-binding RTX toxin-like protein